MGGVAWGGGVQCGAVWDGGMGAAAAPGDRLGYKLSIFEDWSALARQDGRRRRGRGQGPPICWRKGGLGGLQMEDNERELQSPPPSPTTHRLPAMEVWPRVTSCKRH